jgi:histone demethylase JARID1
MEVYINTSEMLETFSRDIIYKKMPPPYIQTLFVELIAFVPGQPEMSTTSRPSSSTHLMSPKTAISHTNSMHYAHSHHHSAPQPAPLSAEAFITSAAAQHVPPPPPWSRWGTMSTPARPPSTQRRQSTSSRSTPQPSSRKRKHLEEVAQAEDFSRMSSSSASSAPSSKRRALPATPSSPPARPVQTLSPSLAMIVSPVNQKVITSPRSPYIPTIRNNGMNGSPPSHGHPL